MRKDNSKLARIILDISSLPYLAQPSGNEEKFSAKVIKSHLEGIMESFADENIGSNDIELILLTQSDCHHEEKFRRVIAGKHHEFITYQKLNELLGHDSDAFAYLAKANKIPAITFDREIKEHCTLDLSQLACLDTPGNEVLTLMVLGSETRVVGELPAHYRSSHVHSLGSLFPEKSFQEFERHVEFQSYKKIVVYTDFDQTLCNNYLFHYTKNMEDRINPALAEFLKKLQETGKDVAIRLLTSRPPLYKGIMNNLNMMMDLSNKVADFAILDNSLLKNQIVDCSKDIGNLIEKRMSVCDELQELKEIFSKCQELGNIVFSFVSSLLNEFPENEKEILIKCIEKIRNHQLEISRVVNFFCISDVLKEYHEKHSILIEAKNNCHLSSEKTRYFKNNYIYDTHQYDEKKTLVILIDDDPNEIADLNNKTSKSDKNPHKLFENVDAIGIKIARDNEWSAGLIQEFKNFYLEVIAEAKKRQNPKARFSENFGLFTPMGSSDEESESKSTTGLCCLNL
jgi:hypothetical protein